MAEDNMQWPSEDEDFDATTTTANAKAVNNQRPVSTSPRPVVIKDFNQEKEEEKHEVEPEVPEPVETVTVKPEENHEEVMPSAPEPIAPVEVEQPVMKAQKAPKPPKKPRAPGFKKRVLRSILELIMLVGLIGLGVWSWSLHSDNKDLKKQVSQLNSNPQIAVQKQTQSIIDQVGQLMQLPTDETPTIANVSDASQAKQQSSFFNNAENGDKVLMYVKAGEAILYRPSTGKIILVAPLTFTNTSSTTAPASSTTSK